MAGNSEIKRTMKVVIDGIDGLPRVDDSARRNLRRAFSGVRDILVRLPEDRLIEAEMVADQAQEVLKAATQHGSNTTLIRSSASGLRQAAERLDDIAPRVLTLCRQATDLLE
ncbi:MAG: hypothetical protein QF384_06935 [Alphaproteobacteria bacterium]|jgi:hypothetical protein|nr:hypothetical protein [Alphaproteobacteria bacterium]